MPYVCQCGLSVKFANTCLCEDCYVDSRFVPSFRRYRKPGRPNHDQMIAFHTDRVGVDMEDLLARQLGREAL